MKNKVLVIGGTGPSGYYVVNGLVSRGYDVTVLHRGQHEVEFESPVEHIHCDPNFIKTLNQGLGTRTFDVVIGMYGRLRLVAQVMKGRTPRFIVVGGVSYKPTFQLPVTEDALKENDPRNKLLYKVWQTQQEVMQAHADGHYSVTYLAYGRLYGPRQLAPHEWPIIRRILDGRRQIILPDGGLRLDCRCYAENAAHAVLLAVNKPVESHGQFYNVADEWNPTLRQIIVMIADAMGVEVELVSIPGELARPSYPYWAGGSTPGWVKRQVSDPHHRLRDITKIKTELGYEDVVPVPEAVRRTVQWYLENRPEPGGEVERQLADPFDYAAEDLYIKYAKEYASRIRAIPFAGYQYQHPYAHPKVPGEQ